MVGIVAGNSLGLSSTSLGVLNGGVHNPSAAVGRGKDYAYVNSVTGNLVIQRNDDLIVGLGSDTSVLRTYNSQGQLDDDNADNWRIGFYRSIKALSGTVNTAGSSVVRVDADGAETLYRYDSIRQAYVSKDGAGAYDTLTFSDADNSWTWNDGASTSVEIYGWDGTTGKLQTENDAEGNLVSYAYNGNLLTTVTNASGESTHLEYTGNNLTQIKNVFANGQESVLVRYQYDSLDRLSQVIVDLTPEDSSIADGKTYVTNYTYDGDSHRVSSVIQSDGSALYVTYQLIAGKQRVVEATQVVDGKPQTTKYTYKTSPGAPTTAPTYSVSAVPSALIATESIPATINLSTESSWGWIMESVYGITDPLHVDAAIKAFKLALGITELPQESQDFTVPLVLTYTVEVPANDSALEVIVPGAVNTGELDPSALNNTVPSEQVAYLNTSDMTVPGWTPGALLESSGLPASAPQLKYDGAGNAHAVWIQDDNVYYQQFDAESGTWSAVTIIDSGIQGVPGKPSLSVSSSGNVIIAWVQDSNIHARRMIAGVWQASAPLEQASGAATSPIAAITNDGRSVVLFAQTDGTRNNLYSSINQGSGWQQSTVAIDDVGALNNNGIETVSLPNLAVDEAFNISVAWRQRSGSDLAESLFYTRYDATSAAWSNPQSTLFETSHYPVTQSQMAFDGQGNGLIVWQQGPTLFSRSYDAVGGVWSEAVVLSPDVSGTVALSMSAGGKAVVVFKEYNELFAHRYSTQEGWDAYKNQIASGVAAAVNPSVSINDAGQAAVSFLTYDSDNSNVWVARYENESWTANPLEGNNNTARTFSGDAPRVAIDANGNVQVLWLQKNEGETVSSLIGAQYGASYYVVPEDATWESIAITLYGDANVAQALRTALNDVPLVPGTKIRGILEYLNFTQQIPWEPHYYVPQDSTTWASIGLALYGSEAAGEVLRQSLGDPWLYQGLLLTGLPETLTWEEAPTLGLTVAEDTTWESIAAQVYGDATLANALAAAMGNPALTVGTVLTGFPVTLESDPGSVEFSPTKEHVVSAGETWADIFSNVYGGQDEIALAQLRNLLGDPPLVEGETIVLPLSFVSVDGTNVTSWNTGSWAINSSRQIDPYYRLIGGETWEQVAEKVYGSADPAIVTALQAANAGIDISIPGKLSVPLSLGVALATPASPPTEMSVTDPMGGVTTYRYDVLGNLKEIVRPHEANSSATEEFFYDESGNLVRHEGAFGLVRAMVYDDRGNLVRESGDMGLTIERTYNAQNFVTSEVTNSPTAKKAKQFVYDASSESRLRFSISDSGEVTEYRYDSLGRNNEILRYQNKYATSFSGNGVIQTSVSQMEAWTAGQSIDGIAKTELAYDFRGQVASTTTFESLQSDGTGVVDGTEAKIQYVYDARGQLLQTIDATGKSTSFTYDGLGRLLSSQNALGQLDLTSYDDAGSKTIVSYKNGLVRVFTYDTLGRLVTAQDQNSTGTELGTSKSYYDDNGNLLMRNNPTGEKTWSLYNSGGVKTADIDADGTLTEYRYDEFDRLIQAVVYSQNVDTSLLVDAAGIPLNPTVDAIRPSGIAADSKKWLVYDAGGRLRFEVDALGGVTETTYDEYFRSVGTQRFGRSIDVSVLSAKPNVNEIRQLLWLPPVQDIPGYQYVPQTLNPIVPQVAVAGVEYSFRIPDNTFNDTNLVDSRSYTASMLDGSALPSWLKFNSATKTFYGVPPNGDLTELTVQISLVSETHHATATQSLKLFVVPRSGGIEGGPNPYMEHVDFGAAGSNLDIVPNYRYQPLVLRLIDGISPEDIKIGRNRYDETLYITIPKTGATFSSARFFALGYGNPGDRFWNGLYEIQFASGVVWDRAQIGIQANAASSATNSIEGYGTADTLWGGDGDDQIQGNRGDDVIDGGGGNDYLQGGDGSDTYIFRRGSGKDSISNSANEAYGNGSDKVRFLGLSPSDLKFTFSTTGLLVQVKGTTDSLTISGYFVEDGFRKVYGYAVENFEFGDGTTWTIEDVKLAVGISTNGDDQLGGFHGNDVVRGDAGNDSISGGFGEDLLEGGIGDDTIDGGQDSDTLHGEAGDDKLLGGYGDDTLIGGSGNDSLKGEIGDDYLSGGTGDDTLEGGWGDDVLDGGAGNDRLGGGAGSDTYLFGRGSGQDIIDNSKEYNSYRPNKTDIIRLVGLNPEDVVFKRVPALNSWAGAGIGSDLLILIKGTNDSLRIERFYASADMEQQYGYAMDGIEFGNGVVWTTSDMQLAARQGTAGDDQLGGEGENDTIDGLEGDDTIIGGDGDDVLDGGLGNDNLYGGTGNDSVLGGAGDDILVGNEGNDTLAGANGNDSLDGNDGDDNISGGQGTDTIKGGAGNDILDGGAGNDQLEGGAGSDTYVFGRGSGQDVIANEAWGDNQANKTDVIRLLGLAPEDVTFTRTDNTRWLQGSTATGSDDLLIHIKGTNDTLRVLNFFAESSAHQAFGFPVDAFEFGNGVTWTGADVNAAVTLVTGEDDRLVGGVGADTIDGEAGDDSIHGRDGDDTLIGGTGNDTVNGGDGADSLQGGAGEDSLVGGAGNDLLEGGAGNDYLEGGLGSDTYVFGLGSGQDTVANHTYAGDDYANRTDTVRLAGLSPADVIFTREWNSQDLVIRIKGSTDTLRISQFFVEPAGAPSYGYAVDRFEFGNGVQWDYAQAVAAVVDANTAPPLPASQHIHGTTSGNVLSGGGGNDYVYGNGGADTYVFGRGQGSDTINNAGSYETGSQASNADKVVLTNLLRSEVRFSRQNDSLIMHIADSDETLTVLYYFDADGASAQHYRIDTFQFSDGSTVDFAQVNAAVQETGDGTDNIWGYETDDTISVGAGADSVQGAGGNDSISGGQGNDTLSGGTGNDTIQGDDGNDSVNGDAGNDQLAGGAGNDTIRGGWGDDRLDGGAGDDTLYGEEGADTYVFGRGYGNDTVIDYSSDDHYPGQATAPDTVELAGLLLSDVGFKRDGNALYVLIKNSSDTLKIEYFFNGVASGVTREIAFFRFSDGSTVDNAFVKAAVQALGDGNDVVWGYNGADTLSGGEGADQIFGEDGDDVLSGGENNDTISGGNGADTIHGDGGKDTLTGGDGADSIYGGAGNDVIDGGAGNDRLDGGTGDDILQGNDGSDTYVFGRDSGNDTIRNGATEYYATTLPVDTVEMSGLVLSDVIFRREDSNLRIVLKDSHNTLLVEGFFDENDSGSGYREIDVFRFSDGSIVNAEYVKNVVSIPTAENDLILGSMGPDVLTGLDGNDTLRGGWGDDTFDGGAGNDTLHGLYGSNKYLFGRGDGRDVIAARDLYQENLLDVRGVIAFKAGVLPSDVMARRVGANLEVIILGSGDTVTIEKFFAEGTPSNRYNPVQLLSFADGTQWDLVSMFEPRVERKILDASGKVLGHLDAGGQLTRNMYDGMGRLIQTTVYAAKSPGNPDTWATATVEDLTPYPAQGDQTTVFLYNAKGQQVAQIDAEGYLTESVYDLAGNVTQTVRYATKVTTDAVALAVQQATAASSFAQNLAALRPAASAADQTRSYSYDDLHRLSQKTEIDGTVTEYSYNLAGQLSETVAAQGTGEKRTLTARYDLQGRLTAELSANGAALLTGNQTPAQIDAIWQQHGVFHSYDASGRRISTADSFGTTTFIYDADSRLTHSINGLGEVTERTYDVFGQIVANTVYAQRVVGAPGTVAGGVLSSSPTDATVAALQTAKTAAAANNSVTRFEFDATGKLLRTINPEGAVVNHVYNSLGEEIERITELDGGRSVREVMLYDGESQLLKKTVDVGGLGIELYTEYDTFGRVVRSVDANGNQRSQTYDRLGRVLTQTQPSGMGRETLAVATTSYDAFGRVLSQTDSLGHTSTYSYDDAARSVTMVTPESITVTTTLNRFGQTSSVLDGRGNVTSYEYDDNGNLVRTDRPVGSTTGVYDERNRLIEAYDANGNLVGYAYDAANRVLTRTVDPSGLASTTQYVYDAKGQQISVIDANNNRIDVAYDRNGRTISQTVDPTGLALTTSYSHDIRGNVVRATASDGAVTEYEYDVLGRRVRETVDPDGLALTKTFAYDNKGNVTSSVDANGSRTLYVYDERDQLVYTIDALGQVKEVTYDSEGRVTEIRSRFAPIPANALSDLGLSPNFAQTRALVIATVTAIGYSHDTIEWRQYDDDNRLTASVNSLGEVTTFQYDGNGNVVEQRQFAQREQIYVSQWNTVVSVLPSDDDIVVTSTYDANNRLSTVSNGLGLVTTYTYDAHGNVTAMNGANGQSGTTTLVYGRDNRLLMSTGPEGQRHWFLYDAAGRKAAEIDSEGTLTEFKYNRNNQVTHTIVYANRVDVTTLTDTNGQPTTGFNANVAAAPAGSVTLQTLRPATSASDLRSWSIYDEAGLQVAQIDGLGHVSTIQRDAAHRVVGSTQYANAVNVSLLGDGTQVALAVDGTSLIIGQTARASGPAVELLAASTAAADREQEQVLDKSGRVLADIDALGYITQNRYDATGRLVQTVSYALPVPGFANAAGFASRLAAAQATGSLASLLPALSAEDQTNFHYYNALGQKTAQVDAEGYLTEATYDSEGQLLQTVRYANKVANAPTVASTLDQLRPVASAQDQYNTTAWNAFGLVESQVNAQGTKTTYDYDVAGKLSSSTKGFGAYYEPDRTSTVRRDLQGRVIAELSAEGAALLAGAADAAAVDAIWAQYGTTHVLNGAGQRISTTDPVGNRTAFYYDGEGRLRYTVNAEGELSERSYDSFGRLIQTTAYATRITAGGWTGGVITAPGSAAVAAQIEAATAAGVAGNSVVRYEYDVAGRIVKSTDAEGAVVRHTFNAFGEETERVTEMAGDDLRQVNVYDNRGQLTSTQADPTGINAHQQKEYDAFGRLVSSVDANGNTRTQTYDRLGRVITQTKPEGMGGASTVNVSSSYDAFGRVLTQTDEKGFTTSYAYSDSARSIAITSPEGIVVTTTTNRFGQTASVKDGRDYITIFEYDRDGNLVKTTAPHGEETKTYDTANRLIEERDFNGNLVTYDYDAANRVLSRTVDPAGLAIQTQYVYDAKGQRVSVIDPNNNRTDIAYDLNGRTLSQTVDPAGLALTTSYTHDELGNVLSVTAPNGTVTEYEYDVLGRRVRETVDPAGLALTKTYAYDTKGNVTSSVDANGQRTLYVYDARDQLVYTIDPLGQVQGNVYDAKGRIIQVRKYATAIAPSALTGLGLAPSVVQARAVIAAGTLDSVEHRIYDNDDRVGVTLNALGEVTTYVRDKSGNVLSTRNHAHRIDMATWVPETHTLAVIDDVLDQVDQWTYDGSGRVITSNKSGTERLSFTYDGNGNVLSRTNVDAGTTDRFSYDNADRLVLSMDEVGAVTKYEYDPAGQVIRETRFANKFANPYSIGEPDADPAHDQVRSFAYDAAGRQRFAMDATGGVVQSTYDALGKVTERVTYVNRIPADTALTESAMAAAVALIATANVDQRERFAYDAAGRQRFAVNGVGGVTESVYDAQGNVIKRVAYAQALSPSAAAGAPAATLDDQATVYAFDAANRQVAMVDALGGVTTFTYDAKGNLVERRDYAIRATAPDALSNAVDTGIFVAQALAAASADDRIMRQGFDAQNRAVVTIDASGAVTRQQYDAFGLLRVRTAYATALSELTLVGLESHDVTAAISGLIVPTSADRVTVDSYDRSGRLQYSVDPAGYITYREYDLLGRMTAVVQYATPVTGLGTDLNTHLTSQSIAAAVEGDAKDQVVRYGFDAAGNLLSVKSADGKLEVTTYDGAGNKLTRTDKNNAVWEFDYDAAGHVIEERSPSVTLGSIVEGAGAHLEAGAATSENIVTRYSYDGAGQVAQKIEAFGRPEQRDSSYAYDGAGHQIRTTYSAVGVFDAGSATAAAVGAATRSDQQLVLNTSTSYDVFGNAIALTDTAGFTKHQVFDKLGQLRFEVDAMGYVTGHLRDRFGNVTQLTRYNQGLGEGFTGHLPLSALNGALSTLASGLDRTITTEYDKRNLAVRVTEPVVWANSGNGGAGYAASPVTENSYDTFGSRVQERRLVDAPSNTWLTNTFFYDIRGLNTASIDGMGYLTTQDFDAWGNVTRTTEFAKPALGNSPVPSETSLNDRTTLIKYDLMNRQVERTQVDVEYSAQANGTRVRGDLVTKMSYDALGNVLTTTDALNNVTTNTYDALGRLASSDSPAAALTRFVRDAHGNAILITQEGGYYDGGNRVTLTKYDSHSHAVQVTRVSTDAQGNNNSSSSFQSYDSRGLVSRQWQVVQGNSGATQTLFKGFKYDALGRTTHSYTAVGTSSLSTSSAALAAQQAAGFVDQDMEYNAFGEVISRGTNGYDARETYLYDNGGNLVRSYAAGQDASSSGKGAVVTFTLYDLLGRQSASIESDGEHDLSEVFGAPTADALSHSDVRRTDYQLDVLGRAVQITLAQREGNGGGTATRPVMLQTFDRWGNTLSQSDPRSADWVTHYQYNAFNQVVQRVQPVVGTLGSGEAGSQVTPTTQYFTDALGRQVAERDANGNLNGKVLDAAGRITREAHADGGNVDYAYNAFGERTQVTDAMGYVTKYAFDQQGRQTEIINDSLETYALSGDDVVSQGSLQIKTKIVYDQAGRVLSKTNGAGETTSFEYDARGNVIATTQPMGQVSRAAYDSQGNEIASQNLNGDLTQASYDDFGRLLNRTDISGATISFTHDHAGQVTSKTSSRGQDIDYQYDNVGNLLHVTDNATGTVSHYEYDARGARIFEQTDKNGENLQNQTLGYDELGRLSRIDGIDGISVIRTYDAVGNVIQQYVQSGVPLPSTTEGMKLKDVGKAWTQVDTKIEVVIDPATGEPEVDPVTGAVVTREVPVYGWKDFKQLRNDISTEQGSRTSQVQYFAYDSMNRQILVDGAVNNNAQDQANLTADQGHILTYDLNGNRTSDTYFGRQVVATARPFARDENGNILLDENGNPQYGFVSDRENEGNSASGNGDEALGATYYSAQLGAVTQTYTYDHGNRLKSVSQQSVNAQGSPSGVNNLLDIRKYDAAGRMIQTGPDGGMDANFVRALTGESLAGSGLVTKKSHFNANGQLERMEVLKADGSLSYNVYYDQQDAMGNITQYRVVDHKDVTQTYTRTYDKYDSYVETAVHGVRSDNTSRPSDSASTYDVNGNLLKVSETHWPEDNPKATEPLANLERFFSNDANGIILKKEQEGNVLKQLVVNGNVVTSYGKGVDSDKPYDEKGKTNYVAQGEFGLTFKAINSRSAAGNTNYTIRDGDTLSSIALNVWGDSSLWWKIADANGLAATGPNDGLTKGQTVTLPGQISGVHNNADTFKPYDPSEVVGDTTPNMPAPPPTGKGGCGVIGKIIMIVVAVVVTVFTAGALSGVAGGLLTTMQAGVAALTGAGTVSAAGLAAAAAAGSVVSQVVGIAIGAQESFSWKAVGLAALSAGVTAGVGSVVDFSSTLGGFGNLVARAAIGNVITQGISVATGLQKSFDWKGVAGAAVGTAVGAGVSSALGEYAGGLIGRTVTGIAAGAASALVGGGKVSIGQIAINAFGNAMGEGLAASMGQQTSSSTTVMNEEMLRDDFWAQTLGAVETRGVPQVSELTFSQDMAARREASEPAWLEDWRDSTAIQRWERDLLSTDGPEFSTFEPGPPVAGPGGAPDLLIKTGASANWLDHQRAAYKALDDISASLSTGGQDAGRISELSRDGLDRLNQARLAIQSDDALMREIAARDLTVKRDAVALAILGVTGDAETTHRVAVAVSQAGGAGRATAENINAQLKAYADFDDTYLSRIPGDVSIESGAPGLYLNTLLNGRTHVDTTMLYLATMNDRQFDQLSSYVDKFTESGGLVNNKQNETLVGLIGLQGSPAAMGRLTEGLSIAGLGLRNLGRGMLESIGQMDPATFGNGTLGKLLYSPMARPMYVVPRSVGGGAASAPMGPNDGPQLPTVDLTLKYKRGWTDAQRAEADAKVKYLNEDPLTIKTEPIRAGQSAAERYRKEVGPIPAGKDVDHKRDLQLNGLDDVRANGWLLDSSVNRSLGSQISNQLKKYPLGTTVNGVTIRDRDYRGK